MSSIGAVTSSTGIDPFQQRKEKKEFSLTETFLANEGVDFNEKSESGESQGMSLRDLTPEEERRLAKLRDMLNDLLLDMGDSPTEAQKRRIRDIEKEIEEITGVEVKTRLSDGVHALNKAKLDKEEEEGEEGGDPMLRRKGFALHENIARHVHAPVRQDVGEGLMSFQQRLAANAYAMQAELPETSVAASAISAESLLKNKI
ncbi:hypothetical protein [Salidesulfovibrio brasiliensis]|uniref:hypothetical protein n=1 Tax=Salidesulfovibrio brasiliensis TaxID=221711 RepID=UPI0006D1ED0B|nr:hypothetical protein [Salidesulfovibrio brasiliensis]